MTTISRNAPCPCGSGRKYKKCCMQAASQPASAKVGVEGEENPSRQEPGRRKGLNIHGYAIAKMVENFPPSLLSELSKRDIAALKAKWSIGKLARLDTADIVSRLHGMGVDASPSAFLALAEGRLSAWSIGETWLAGMDNPPIANGEDFLFLAACELWKRYCPERPSDEMVDDWVTEGSRYTETGANNRAADIWLRVWELVRPRLRPDMTTFMAADSVFEISQCFNNWIQDFAMAVQNAALDDRKYAEIGIRVAREVLAQFKAENVNTILNFRCDLGRLLFLAGRREEGDALLRAVIREYPHLAHGYVSLADELSFRTNDPAGISRAIELLEEARARPVEDVDGWDIEMRLKDLRAKML